MELHVNGRINQTGIWKEGVNFMNELEIPLVLLLLSIQTGPLVSISLYLSYLSHLSHLPRSSSDSRQEPPVVFSAGHKDDERGEGMWPPDLIKTLPSCYDKHN